MSFFRRKTTSPSKSPSNPRSSPLRSSSLGGRAPSSPLKLWEEVKSKSALKKPPAESRVSSEENEKEKKLLTVINCDLEERLSNTYLRLLNGRLRERRELGKVGLLRDLRSDLRDGIVLFHLVEVLSGFSIPGDLCLKPVHKIQAIGNLNMVFDALRNIGVKIVKVSPFDIYDGNLKRILGLLWTTILFFALRNVRKLHGPKFRVEEEMRNDDTEMQKALLITPPKKKMIETTDGSEISSSPKSTASSANSQISQVHSDAIELRQGLAAWVSKITQVPLEPDRLAVNLRDGRVFAKLIRRLLKYQNDQGKDIDDYEYSKTPEQNMERSFAMAQAILGVPVLISLTPGKALDEVALVAYLSELQHAVLKRKCYETLSLEEALQDTTLLSISTPTNRSRHVKNAFLKNEEQNMIVNNKTVRESTGSASIDIDNIDYNDSGNESRIAPCPLVDDDDNIEFIEDDPRRSKINYPNDSIVTEEEEDSRRISTSSSNDDDTAVIEIFRCPESSTEHIPEPALHQARIKVAVGVHRARGLFGGRTINPYCIIRYADIEIKTPHLESTNEPIWNHTALFNVDLPITTNKHALITVYIFSANKLIADSLLGKVELLLWNLLDMSNPDDDPWGFTEEEATQLGGLDDVVEDDDDDDSFISEQHTSSSKKIRKSREKNASFIYA
mmetsp:Transcript_788/g.1112  ORF Transcript_788/g.1112 Transcript_788/m.1112 type:complete len:673 (+) Transcript_788:14-2032(+)